ncbi:hypothetical protein QQP08_012022 [Theobroma cacao]|nr:hypothetical protein QQP08_012022 [Theobroma cacao]
MGKNRNIVRLVLGCLGECGLDAIPAKCMALTCLDIQGFWNVKLEGELEDRRLQLLAFKSLWIYEMITDSDEQADDEEYRSSDSE